MAAILQSLGRTVIAGIVVLIVIIILAGVMLGAKIGARLLRVARAETVRKIVIGLLLVAGARALVKGLGIWN